MDEYVKRSEFGHYIQMMKLLRAEVEELRRWKEQKTEEIPAINVNVASADVLDQLKEISTDIDELKIAANAYTSDAAIFKNKVERMESDVSTIKSDMEQVKTVQKGHSKFFEEHGKRIAATATKEDLSQLKDEMRADMSAMKNEILDAVKQLLQQKQGE
jgi:gas vesicle protein